MRLARKLPAVRPLAGLVVHLCGQCRCVQTAEREPDPPPPKWLQLTRGLRHSCSVATANDPDMDDQPKTRLICRRCAARMKLVRQLSWLDHRLPAILLFQCIDCGHVDMVEWPESEGEEAP
jgi:hypothetical protein